MNPARGLSQSWLRRVSIGVVLATALFVLVSAESQAVLWGNTVNVSVVNGVLQKTSGCDGCEDAGATSQQAGGIAEISMAMTSMAEGGSSAASAIRQLDSAIMALNDVGNKLKTFISGEA